MNKPLIHTASDLETPLSISYERALEAIQQGELSDEAHLMRWGSNYTFLMTLHHDELTMLAVYKPRMGERPLWDFPDGTLCQRETASYVISAALGWHIVPPTVLRDGPRGIGSLQVFINHDPNRHYFTFDDAQKPEVMRMALFDAIINNADRKGGHCLLDEDDRVWGIDHGLTFHPANKLRTVIWEYAGKPIPEDLLTDLSKLCQMLDNQDDPFIAQLAELISNGEMMTLQRRVNRLLSMGCYPMPGQGPNRPWPAI